MGRHLYVLSVSTPPNNTHGVVLDLCIGSQVQHGVVDGVGLAGDTVQRRALVLVALRRRRALVGRSVRLTV